MNELEIARLDAAVAAGTISQEHRDSIVGAAQAEDPRRTEAAAALVRSESAARDALLARAWLTEQEVMPADEIAALSDREAASLAFAPPPAPDDLAANEAAWSESDLAYLAGTGE